MKIYGREIGFLRTVKATSEIAKICPNGDIERLSELLMGDLSTTLETYANIIHYLNEGYEMNKHFMDRSYQPQILGVDEIMSLDNDTYTELVKTAMAGIQNGAETTIETEPTKKKEKSEQTGLI